MSKTSLSAVIEMTEMSCGACGITFYAPEVWRAEKQQTGDGWYCPNGHGRVYCESDVEKARKELAAERERHKVTLARLNEAKAAAARLRSRVGNGVCPCCQRTFKQLARHMKAKHPNYAKEKDRG